MKRQDEERDSYKSSEVEGNGRDQVSPVAEDGLERRGLEGTGMEQREGCDLE